MSNMSRSGAHRKALELFYCLPQLGIPYDTTITNAAISACEKGIPPPSASCLEAKYCSLILKALESCPYAYAKYLGMGKYVSCNQRYSEDLMFETYQKLPEFT